MLRRGRRSLAGRELENICVRTPLRRPASWRRKPWPHVWQQAPARVSQFKPTCDDADVANRCTIEQLFNSYDNTILYVDHVLGRIIHTLDDSGAPYVFIYLSDHGESLMEDGYLFHGMPPGMALPAEQAQVPLIVKASVPISIAERPNTDSPMCTTPSWTCFPSSRRVRQSRQLHKKAHRALSYPPLRPLPPPPRTRSSGSAHRRRWPSPCRESWLP